MRWIPTQVSVILLPSTPRGVLALMEKNNSYVLAAKRILFPERHHPAGFVEALPATSQPTPHTRLLQCRSPTPLCGSAFQLCFTSLGRSLGCPQPNPEGASWLFAAWVLEVSAQDTRLKCQQPKRSWRSWGADMPLQQKLLVAGQGKPLSVQTSGVAPGSSTTAHDSGCSVVRMHT